jgi:CheY-like chemotaxis protein
MLERDLDMTTEKTRVLVIDDDELVRCGVAYLLDRLGFVAVLVESGADALARLEKEDFDIVFCDLMMPGMNGIETIRRVKRATAAPIVAMSGGGRMVDAMHALKAAKKLGIDATLEKPFGLAELRACLDLFLARLEPRVVLS